MNKIVVALTFLIATTVASHAKQPSFLCQGVDTKGYYVDVVSTGKNAVLVQLNGGDFLEGEAEYKEPMLYIFVPITNGIFGVVFDVKQNRAISITKVGEQKQVHELECKFRE